MPDGYNFKNWGGARVNIKKNIGAGGEKLFQLCKEHIKIIHFSGRRKPWASHIDTGTKTKNPCSVSGLKELKNSTPAKMWHEYYEECFGEKCHNSIMIDDE